MAAQKGNTARELLEWVLTGDGSWFKRADFPNPSGFSGAALTQALASLAEQGILEHRGEKRGREHRLRTEYLREVYGGTAWEEQDG